MLEYEFTSISERKKMNVTCLARYVAYKKCSTTKQCTLYRV